MRRRAARHGGRDRWGARPRDPFGRWLLEDPRRGAFLSATVTVGLILFWVSIVLGLIVYILVMIL